MAFKSSFGANEGGAHRAANTGRVWPPHDASPSNVGFAPTTPIQGSADALAAPSVRPGDVLGGKYVVDSVIGMGGMGVVVAARHTTLDRPIALKFLRAEACRESDAVARFLREGRAAARITSEHVARVLDTGTLDNGSPYLVMEYLEGADLGAVLRREGALRPSVAVDYVLQAAEAIVEAHELGIVHRDLKPANLFLTQRKDGSPLVKVLDFGISKSVGGVESALTTTSSVMGSPRYMAPEQMLSPKTVDARADLWALGAILYELVAGVPAWDADTMHGLCAQIASGPSPRLRARAPHAPQLLEDVILRCFAKSPAGRMTGVAELARALEPIASEIGRSSVTRIVRMVGRRASSHPPPVQVPISNQAAIAPTVAATISEPPPASALPVANTISLARTEAPGRRGRAVFIGLMACILGASAVLIADGIQERRRAKSTPTVERLSSPPASVPAHTAPPATESAPATSLVSIQPAPTMSSSARPTITSKRPRREGSPHTSSKPSTPALPPDPAPTPTPITSTSNDNALSDRK